MSDHKFIKDSFLKPDRYPRLSKLLYPLKRFLYYPIHDFMTMYYERISRSLAFAKHGWLHYDFESAYLYDIMAFKMKRILAVLEDGHLVNDNADIAALKEAIEICTRLRVGDYDWKYLEAHNAKWGDLDDNLKRPNVKPKDRDQERAEFMQCWENGEKDRHADIDRLGEILKKHEPTWWD